MAPRPPATARCAVARRRCLKAALACPASSPGPGHHSEGRQRGFLSAVTRWCPERGLLSHAARSAFIEAHRRPAIRWPQHPSCAERRFAGWQSGLPILPAQSRRAGLAASAVSVHRDDWKLIRIFHGGENGAHRHLLFNLRDDLGEKEQPRRAKKPELVTELDALIEKFPHRHESRRARAESGV
jgi:hypothetical protein